MPIPLRVPTPAFSSSNTTITTTTETIAATITNVSTDFGYRVVLNGWCVVTFGTNTTGVVMTIRRGASTSSPIVYQSGTISGGVAAASITPLDAAAVDTPGEVASQSYCMTVTVVGASANSTISVAWLTAIVQP